MQGTARTSGEDRVTHSVAGSDAVISTAARVIKTGADVGEGHDIGRNSGCGCDAGRHHGADLIGVQPLVAVRLSGFKDADAQSDAQSDGQSQSDGHHQAVGHGS